MPPASDPYPAAPPISEPYGSARPAGALAGRWQRLFAAIIDGLIINAVTWLIAIPSIGSKAVTGAIFSADRFGGSAIMVVIAILYFGLQHGKWGQTIGKRALGMRVVRAADSGPISLGAAFGRAVFTYGISYITVNIFGVIDVLFVLWDPRKQALHDKVVNTIVVNADGPDPYAAGA